MQECNSPRNSRLQTHQDDGIWGEASEGFALVFEKKTTHRIDRFAHASKNSNRAFGANVGASRRLLLRLAWQR